MFARLSRWIETYPGVSRAILAGPIVFVASLAVLAAMPLWLPTGAAGIDHMILPMILFPGIWALLFFYALSTEKLLRAGAVVLAIMLINGAVAWLASEGRL